MAWSNTHAINKSKLVFFEIDNNNNFVEFGLPELLSSSAEVLGKGTFGMCYKVDLPNKNVVVVKRLKGRDANFSSEMEYKESVEELGNTVHENLLPIRAYCFHENERLLIYDYMGMGSLAFLLHGNGGANGNRLTWEVRVGIAYGVACGVDYLHKKGSNICHGNIRSSNVFLNDQFDVRLSEFGMSKLMPDDINPCLIAGYRAPDMRNARDVSQKSDVYSFGVLLLELLTGKPPLNVVVKEKGIDLPKWVRSSFQDKPVIDIFDIVLHQLYNNVEKGEQMVQLLQLAICCTFRYPNKRPSMAAVVNRIAEICRLMP